MLSILAAGLVLLMPFGAASGGEPADTHDNAQIAEGLITASRAEEAEPLVRLVLSDIVSRAYRFDDIARREAFEAIIRLRLSEVLPDTARVATMALTADPSRRLLDVIAVAGGLRALAELRGPKAMAANVDALRVPDLRGFAIQNLTLLRAWCATRDVEQTFLQMPISDSNGEEVLNFLRFLDVTPRSTRHSCITLSRVRETYVACSASNRPSFCDELFEISARIYERACTE
jgi:hypothetical protein